MKKKPNGFVSVLLALCLLLAPMTVFAESNAQLNYVTDDAGILTDSQWEDLEQRAQQVSEEYQCGVYMITVDDYTDYSTESVYTADYTIYHNYEMGMGEDRDGIMILLSMEDRDYAMFVYGPKASEVFDAYGQEQLETYFLDNFREDDWYGGFGDYIDACSNYLQLAEQGTPVRAPEGYDSGDYEDYEATPGENFGVSFLMALGISCVISIIICLLLLLKMHTVHQKTEANDYVSEKLKLSRKEDRYTHTTQTRRKISSCWSLCVNAPSSGALSKKRADLIDQRSVVILVVVIIKRIEASLDEHGEANVELHIVCIFRFQAVNIFPDR